MIRLDNLTVRSGGFELRDIHLEIPDSRYAVLMGPTGCGKTTLLEAICGLKPVLRGAIYLGGREVTGLPPGQRGVGYVPQDVALFDAMSVRENLGFALEIRKWPAAAIGERVLEMAGLLGITPLLDRRPGGLSGGEAQRVALGRALACRPDVLCLDEPLSALDAATREEMCGLLQRLQAQTGVTILHVTHDQQEARRLAQRTFQFANGGIQAM